MKNNKKFILIATSLVITGAVIMGFMSRMRNNRNIVDNNIPDKEDTEVIEDKDNNTTDNNQDDYYFITKDSPKKHFVINIEEDTIELNGKKLNRYLYTDTEKINYPAGLPVVVYVGDTITFDITNNTNTTTNIHWHGLSVPNDQDGPGIIIDPNGGKHDYEFIAERSGTYWYHSHERPVRDQVDFGMYAPIIVLDKEDPVYDVDKIMVVDDWVVNRNTGHMQVEGDVDVVNGKTGKDIQPIVINDGEVHRYRFINASSAKVHYLNFPFDVRVTHSDGRPLAEPYLTNRLVIDPSERYDVEIISQKVDSNSPTIKSEDNMGLEIPIIMNDNSKEVSYVYEGRASEVISQDLLDRDPDFIMELGDGMKRGVGHVWTINGDIFENLDYLKADVNKEYKFRFINDGMHRYDHPMHIHGEHFKVIAIDGKPFDSELYKDTMNIPYGSAVDVAITFTKPGTWMIHCHILDHEDGGMMTAIEID